MGTLTPIDTTLRQRLDAWERLRHDEGYWVDHPDHPVADWQAEVANDDTRESYDEWVVNCIENRFDEEHPLPTRRQHHE